MARALLPLLLQKGAIEQRMLLREKGPVVKVGEEVLDFFPASWPRLGISLKPCFALVPLNV